MACRAASEPEPGDLSPVMLPETYNQPGEAQGASTERRVARAWSRHWLRFWLAPERRGSYRAWQGWGSQRGAVKWERPLDTEPRVAWESRSSLGLFSPDPRGMSTFHALSLASSCPPGPGTSLPLGDVTVTGTLEVHDEDSYFAGGETEVQGGDHLAQLNQLVSGGVGIPTQLGSRYSGPCGPWAPGWSQDGAERLLDGHLLFPLETRIFSPPQSLTGYLRTTS